MNHQLLDIGFWRLLTMLAAVLLFVVYSPWGRR
jgi:hypothetical protein